MKKYKNLIFSRIFMTGLLILIQILWISLFFLRIFELYPYVSVIIRALGIIFVVYLVNNEHEPLEYKMGWVIIILIFPIFGVPFYLFCGDKRPSRKLSRKLMKAAKKFEDYHIQDEEIFDEIKEIDKRAAATTRYIMNDQNFPVYKNTEITYYKQGEEIFEAMLEAINSARHFVFLEYFTIEIGNVWTPILDALVEKAKQGVEVRLLYDDMGCVPYLPLGYDKYIEELHPNIKCARFNKVVPFFSLVMNNRDHRKMMVVDGHISFTGGINLSDRYINIDSPYGHWKDAGVKMVGEATWNITLMFLEMWNTLKKDDTNPEDYMPHTYHKEKFEGHGYVQPFGDEPLDDVPFSENIYIEMANQAENYLYIYTPYLILSEELADAIMLAARRDVDVRIVTPGIPDKKAVYRLTRSNYRRLIRAGVKIYEYTPGFIHSKCMLADDIKAIVGTVNLDYRSLFLHFEDAVFFCNNEAILDLKKDMDNTFNISRRVKQEDIKVGFLGGILNSILKVFSPLM